MTHGDFIPDSAQNLRDWADNYKTELPAIATRIGWPTANVTKLNANLTAISAAAQEVLDAQNVLRIKSGLLAQAKADNYPDIRLGTSNLKTTSGFTDGDATTLGVLSSSTALDPATYKPELKAVAHPGFNEITGKKRGVQAMNLYMRLKGTATWTRIATKRTTFPFDDDTPPAVAGKPEEREYLGMGVMGDDEIGQPSDIVSAVFHSM